MITKKIAIVVAVLAAALCPSAPAVAQTVGEWRMFALFNQEISNIVETPGLVYYLSAKRLYSYNKDTNETYSYGINNKLNDNDIHQIYYNAAKGYLLVAYETGNIDLIYDKSGQVVNMPDIPAATLTTSKTINHVFFHDNNIYVATNFGLVVFDENRHYVLQSGQYADFVGSVFVMHDRLYLTVGINGDVYWQPLGGRVNSLDKFSRMSGALLYATAAFPMGDKLLLTTSDKKVILTTPNVEDNTVYRLYEDLTPLQPAQTDADGNVTLVARNNTSGDVLYTVYDNTGQVLRQRALPDGLKNQMVITRDDKSFWGVDADGLAQYALGDATVAVTMDKARPEAISCNQVAYIVPSKNAERIYLSNLGSTKYKSIGMGDGFSLVQHTDVIEGGVPREASVYEASAEQYNTRQQQELNNSTRMYGGCQRIAVDPVNPDRYYLANYLEGVYVVENNKEVGKFTLKNMPTYCFWGNNSAGALAQDVNIDPQGNLWVGCWVIYAPDYSKVSPYTVLPAAKLQGDLSAISVDDWQMSKHRGVDIGSKDMGSIFSTHSNMMFTWHGNDTNPLGVTDTKGTYANTSDDVFVEFETTTDQDGGLCRPQRWICAAEDRNGQIWFGTTSGILVIQNPAKCLENSFNFVRPKVPRRDGTNFADYLLESDQINCIAVDGQNRKWVATETAGVYLVSENGDEILQHYTAENSDLPSNSVYSVFADPNSNVVYFGLGTGLMAYNSTAMPAAESYDNVYAYPNPVRPDYHGWITIRGLMDNSLVKIADAAGNVVHQTRSEGGMAVWDGCNDAGERVRTGVYFVFASQNADGNSSGAVTKILVVN